VTEFASVVLQDGSYAMFSIQVGGYSMYNMAYRRGVSAFPSCKSCEKNPEAG